MLHEDENSLPVQDCQNAILFLPRSGSVQPLASGNAGWPSQFRFAVHGFWSRVPELWSFGAAINVTIDDATYLFSENSLQDHHG